MTPARHLKGRDEGMFKKVHLEWREGTENLPTRERGLYTGPKP